MKAILEDTHGFDRKISGTTATSLKKVVWRSVTVTKHGEVGAYFISEFGGAIYLSPDYPRGRILDSGEMIRDCESCGFAAGQFVFSLVTTSVLDYRKLYLEIRGYGFTDREHPGSTSLIDPATGDLGITRSNPEFDQAQVTSASHSIRVVRGGRRPAREHDRRVLREEPPQRRGVERLVDPRHHG